MITSDTLKDLPPMRFDLSRVVGCAATRWSAARPLLSYLIDSTTPCARRPLRRGISSRLMSAWGHLRPADTLTAVAACPLHLRELC
jgi:hypothetical protein